MTYETVFTNLRRKSVVQVYETFGLLVTLLQGQSLSVESEKSTTTFSRWDSVVFTDDKDCPVKLHVRPGWKEPDLGPLVVSILNEGGQDVERLEIGGQVIFATRGIPIKLAVEPANPLAKYQHLICHLVTRRLKRRDWPGIYLYEALLAWEATLRPQAELDEAKA